MLTENVESYLKDDKLLLFHQMFLWSVYSPFILSVENLFWKKKKSSGLKIGQQCFMIAKIIFTIITVMLLIRQDSFRRNCIGLMH